VTGATSTISAGGLLKPHLWLIKFIGVLVPRRLRADWRQEWEAELRNRETLLTEWGRLDRPHKLDLLGRSLGAFWDALLLQPRRWEDEMIQDLRFAVRMLLKRPGITLIAILTLSLGVGANTAIFSVVHAVLLKPLPYAAPERLAMLWESSAKIGGKFDVRINHFLAWRDDQKVFTELAAYQYQDFNLSGGDRPERIQGVLVTANLFPTLGAQPAAGRGFLPEEERAGRHRVVIVSHDFWRRRFGNDPHTQDTRGGRERTLMLNGEAYRVIGVMPAGFEIARGGGMPQGLAFAPRADLWTPFPFKPEDRANVRRYPIVIGLLRPEVTIEQAQSAMTALARRLNPSAHDLIVKLVPLGEQLTGKVRPALLVLLGAVGLVLLIACANVANLKLAGAAARRREFALRAALGASRLRLARQVVTEGLLLSVIAGAGGWMLAHWLRHLIVAFSPDDLPRVREITLDGTVLGFTLLASILTGVIFSLAPAARFSKPDLNEDLKPSGGKMTLSLSRFSLGSLLVVAEVALALALLLGAGLLLNSFVRLQRVDPGFDSRNVLTMQLSLPQPKYSTGAQMESFHRQALERIEALPGVEAAGLINELPLGGGDVDFPEFTIDGQESTPGAYWFTNSIGAVSPGYFRAMGTTLVRGRYFDARDSERSERVVIVNEAAARRYWQGRDPVGSRISAMNAYFFLVVGVVADVRHQGLESETNPRVYLPHTQVMERMKARLLGSMTLVLRSASPSEPLIAAVQREVSAVDSEQPVSNIRTMRQVVASSVAERAFTTALLGAFAALALLLALIGIYGVMSYVVTQRTHEIGIRVALGAQRSDILRLVIRQGMALAFAGLIVGLPVSLALAQLMKGLLYGVSTTDPLTFGAAAALLMAVALLAALVPARRAMKVDPMVALRFE
jgi:putative ABC transport system permease protein